MCNIAICRDKRLSLSRLEQIESTNPHGVGLAWIDRKARSVRWRKGLTLAQAKLLLPTLPLPYVVHVRLATVGDPMPGLAHPFPVERFPRTDTLGYAKRVLFHNGHVMEWQAILATTVRTREPAGPWSDTRAIAHAVATVGVRLLDHLGGRYAVLSRRGVSAYGRGWSTEDGIEFSSPVYARSVRYKRETLLDYEPLHTGVRLIGGR